MKDITTRQRKNTRRLGVKKVSQTSASYEQEGRKQQLPVCTNAMLLTDCTTSATLLLGNTLSSS